jgi:hypothetical protein
MLYLDSLKARVVSAEDWIPPDEPLPELGTIMLLNSGARGLLRCSISVWRTREYPANHLSYV